MNTVYKQIVCGDGEPSDNNKWHICITTDTTRILCNGDAIDSGGYAQTQIKEVNRGGVTCSHCMKLIKEIKAIRL